MAGPRTLLIPIWSHCMAGPRTLLIPIWSHCMAGPRTFLIPILSHFMTGPRTLLIPIWSHCMAGLRSFKWAQSGHTAWQAQDHTRRKGPLRDRNWNVRLLSQKSAFKSYLMTSGSTFKREGDVAAVPHICAFNLFWIIMLCPLEVKQSDVKVNVRIAISKPTIKWIVMLVAKSIEQLLLITRDRWLDVQRHQNDNFSINRN